MNESYTNPEKIDEEQLAADIRTARSESLESMEKNDTWCSTVSKWDAGFKTKLEDIYGSTRFAQQVPAWQILIGGTVEEEVDITIEQKNYILTEVLTFFEELKQIMATK